MQKATSLGGTPGERGHRAWQYLLLGCAALLGGCGADPGSTLTGGLTDQTPGATTQPGQSGSTDPVTGCTTTTLGDKTTCRDAATWKGVAAMYCASQKESLGGLALSGACGQGQFLLADVQCCPMGSPPPPPPMCETDKLGDGKTCLDPGTIKMEAALACSKKNLVLTDLKLVTPCMGGYTEAEYTCCGSTPPPPMCETDKLVEMSCVSADTLKMDAVAACAAKMGTLTDLQPVGSCIDASGALGYNLAQYTCCFGTPPPPPPMCQTDKLVEMGCVSAGTLKMDATAACAAKKGTLTDLVPVGSCMNPDGTPGYNLAEYTCCFDNPPPPPPPMCEADKLVEMTCVSPATLKMDAAAACAAKKGTLTDLVPVGSCITADGSQGYNLAQYTCCFGTPPPPPGKCFGGTLGNDGSACYDDASWEQQVAKLCAAAGEQLNHLSLSNTCGPGEYGLADYQCCP